MVQVKLGNQIVSIRGRCGGVYFKPGKPGQHIQSMPRTIHHGPLGFQGPLIGKFSVMATFWHLALIAFFGAAWAAFAIAYYFTDKRGESKRITGYNWYIHYTMTFPETDEPHFWGPPHSPYDLPDFVCSSGTTWHLEHTPPEMPLDYPGNYYWYDGEWNGKPYYRTDDKNWYLWWDTTRWALSISLGAYIVDFTYYSPGPDIIEWYKNPDTGKLVHVYAGKHE